MGNQSMKEVQQALIQVMTQQDNEIPGMRIIDWQFVAIARDPDGRTSILAANKQGPGEEGLTASESVMASVYVSALSTITRPFIIDIYAKINSALMRNMNRSIVEAKGNPIEGAPYPSSN